MIRIIKKILLPSIISALLIGSFNSSLYDKKTLAQNYYESELYDDAIIIYEEIFLIEKEVFGYNSLNRLETVEKLYKIHLLNKNADKAKEYIQEYLDIQYSYIVKQQNSFIQWSILQLLITLENALKRNLNPSNILCYNVFLAY